MSPPDRSGVALHGVGREEEGVAVTARAQHHRVGRVRRELTGDQVATDDAGATAVDDHDVDELHATEESYAPEADLSRELLICTQQQLLSGLAAGVERAAHLGAAEAAVVEQTAVLA